MNMNMEIASHSQILVEEKANVRILTLNRPKELNVLNADMVSRLMKLFLAYEKDPSVKIVIVKGKGRAFSAGGDVPPLVRDFIDGKWRRPVHFMYTQYQLDYILATYSKTQVSILNGIVMGGGAGLSIHGRYRIATENTMFAMPEAAIGLLPDVGSSYFLSRLPGFFGEYVGLTGARLDGAEMLACGLATHFVPSSRLAALEEDLCKVGSNDQTYASTILNAYTQTPPVKKHSAYNRLDVINRCFSKKTVEEILSALEREATQEPDKLISASIRAMKKASPASLKIFLRSVRQGRSEGVEQCLIREYRMSSHMVKAEISKDAVEGCRAMLLEKNKNPKWEPSRLEDMTDSMVDTYFTRMDEEEGWEDLKLPLRNNLPASVISKL